MDYFQSLTQPQKDNIYLIVSRAIAKGTTNRFTQSAILAIASKESGFIPKSEQGYGHTTNERIRAVFGSRLASYDETQLTALKANDEEFFDAIYGLPMYGQTHDEGYRYRGRGFNQITFKGNYKMIGDGIGVDLVNNPDKLNEPQVASDSLLYYFTKNFNSVGGKAYLAKIGVADINSFTDTKSALDAVFQANRGWGKTGVDTTGGYDLAKGRVDGFYKMITAL